MDSHANRIRGAAMGAASNAIMRVGAAIVATLATLLCTLTIGAAGANAADAPDANLGVSLGSGATGYTVENLHQQGAKDESLAAVIKWRKDALNDASVKWEGKTMKQYLADNHISESDYLSPKWANALERIAIQRAVEANDYRDGHTRLNGEMAWSATYEGHGSSSEILAWGIRSFASAMDMWAGEKADYVNQTGGVTGHYTTLIDPYYKAYGFGAASSQSYGSVYAGEATPSTGWDETPTNLQGDYTVEANLSIEKMQQGMSMNMPSTLSISIGKPFMPIVKADVYDGRFTMRATWTSSDDSIVTIQSDGSILGKAAGTATLTCTLTDGGTATVPVIVSTFSDVTSTTPHHEDIEWLADQKITTGYEDGTFGGMRTVVRQDMAAFLYRLAGSPTYEPSAEDKARFTDVDASTSHAKEIWWLASKDIAQGYPNGDGTASFGGMRTVVRQDMAAFLKRFADMKQANPTLTDGVEFTDLASAAHVEEIRWLGRTGVTAGWPNPDGRTAEFRGMNDVVRQDMAAFLHRMSTNVLGK